jgi:hypothetical protein
MVYALGGPTLRFPARRAVAHQSQGPALLEERQ